MAPTAPLTHQPLSQMIRTRRPSLSIEIFPPKTADGLESLKARLEQFLKYQPDFISVTYGAGGSTQTYTHELSVFVQEHLQLTALSHLTCVGQSKAELSETLKKLKSAGIRSIMALRGDPPGGGHEPFVAKTGGFSHGSELIELIAEMGGFDIGCAGYPEGHVESRSWHQDVEFLKKKIDAGATFVVTQFFLENAFFYRYREYLYAKGVRVPIIPGILPISNYSQVTKFAMMCGCTIPAQVMRGLYKKSDADQESFGLDHAARQIEDLVKNEVQGIHLYALNKSKTVAELAPLVRGGKSHRVQ